MDNICNLNKCTGCCTCLNVCPSKAIEMKEDQFGYIRPYIDQAKCIKCNLCSKKCPANNTSNIKRAEKAFAVWNADDEDRENSASGGVATVLARTIIEKGGVAFGSIVDSNLNIIHSSAKNNSDLEKFKGSKYVQSFIGDSYKKVKNVLDERKSVIFIGTPCQIDGLNFYLGKDYDNLITVDLICHGVPSRKLLIQHIEKVAPISIDNINGISFRGKNDYYLTLYKNNSEVYKKEREYDLYVKGFSQSLFLRENCYSCKYARPERVSDITIGDFWGLGKEKYFDRRGVKKISVVLPNTQKGLDFFCSCKEKVVCEERDVEEAVNGNDNLRKPSLKHKNYDKFRELYDKYGFEKAAKKCLNREIQKYKISILKGRIKNKIKKIIRLK